MNKINWVIVETVGDYTKVKIAIYLASWDAYNLLDISKNQSQ